MLKDRYWQHQHSDAAKAIQRMHGKTWVKEDPEFINDDGTRWRPPGYKPSRGRSPVHTRFKRKPETIQQDRQALALRLAGHKYREIARLTGYNSPAAAYYAVQRGYHDQLNPQSRVKKLSLASPSRPLPPLENMRLPAKARRHVKTRP